MAPLNAAATSDVLAWSEGGQTTLAVLTQKELLTFQNEVSRFPISTASRPVGACVANGAIAVATSAGEILFPQSQQRPIQTRRRLTGTLQIQSNEILAATKDGAVIAVNLP